LKQGPIGFPETLVWNLYPTLSNNPEERKSQLCIFLYGQHRSISPSFRPQMLPEPKKSDHSRMSCTQFKGLRFTWSVGKNAYNFHINLMRSNLIFRTPRITILKYVQMPLGRRLIMLLQDTLQQNFARSYFIRTFLLIWNDGKKLEPCLTLFAQHFFLLSIPFT